MESSVKACIINANTGNGWYPAGSERLRRSLLYHGYAHDMFIWNGWMNEEFKRNTPYNLKAAAWHEALQRDYDIILWLDSSVWAIKDPYILLDVILKEGYYFWKSGYNCAQTCSDKCLEYYGVTRDTAEGYLDCSTSMFGIHTANETAMQFINKWMQSARDGVFEGSRVHDFQSRDKRFLFHRQDQSAASMIIGEMGLHMYDPGIYSSYYQPLQNDSVVFTMRGM